MHVDDLDILVIADSPAIALESMILTASVVGPAVVNKLEMSIAIAKATITSSSAVLAAQAARRLGALGGKVAMEVRRLGVDHTLSSSSRHVVSRARFKACTSRWKRVKMLRLKKLRVEVSVVGSNSENAECVGQ